MSEQKIKRLFQLCWPYAFLAIFCFVAFYRVFVTHQATFFINMDNVDQFYSWYQKLASSIHQGYLPLWDASTLSGHSFVGEFQQGVFYPLNLLFCWIFGNSTGIPIAPLEMLVGLHFFIASVGIYLFCRTLRLGRVASVLAGLVYAYAGPLGVRSISQTCIFFGLALLPWAVYFAKKFIDDGKWRYAVFSGLALGLIILAGHLQPFIHGFMIIVLLLVINLYKNKSNAKTNLKKYFWAVLLIGCVAIMLSLPQVVLALQYMKNAYRFVGYPIGPGEKIHYSTYATGFSMSPENIFNLINPWGYQIKDGNDIFIGLSALSLILIVIFGFRKQLNSFKRWKENKVFILTLIIFGLLAALGHLTFLAVILYKMPIIYQVRQLSRYLILVHFGVAIFFAIAFSLLSTQSTTLSRRSRSFLFMFGGLVLINSVYIILLRKHLFNVNYGLQWFLAGLTIIVIALFVNKKALLTPLLACLIVANALLNIRVWLGNPGPQNYTYKNLSVTPIYNFLKKDPWSYRVARLDDALPANIANVHPMQTAFGYGATMYKPYFDYISTSNPIRDKTYDLLGTRYLATKSPQPTLRLVMFDQPSKTYLYERNDYYPKIFTKSDIENNLSGKQVSALARFSIEQYSDMKQVYKLKLAHNDSVILSEIYYPGWKAYVDGKPVSIETAEIPNTSPLFKQINVPAGEHTIELRYLF